MKSSIILAIVILALGALPAVFRQQRLAALRQDRQDLTTEAAKLGLPVDALDGAEPRITKRQRADLERHARTTADEVVSFAMELEAMEKSGGEADVTLRGGGCAGHGVWQEVSAGTRLGNKKAALPEERGPTCNRPKRRGRT